MGQDYRSIDPDWRYCAKKELLAKKKPNFYQRMGKPHVFWFGIFCLIAMIVNAREHDLFGVSAFSAIGGIVFYIAFTSIGDLVDGAVCHIMIDGIDFGYRIDAGDLEDFLYCQFENRKIEVEKTGYSVSTLPSGDFWKKERRRIKESKESIGS
ncbi:MAG: hypothetical protein Q8L89_01255 [Gammaproteobacteria bacterium]|nr:hypothetical protein [Gammaproteobacteria bacterium]